MDFETIRLERADRVALVRLWRPERMNAVIEAMYRELGRALESLAADPEVRAVVLTGSVRLKDGLAKPAFCAGADLKEHATGSRTPEQRRAYIELAHATCSRLARHPQPVIAAVNGPARGAGAELVLCCDLVLMSEEATLGFPETGLGTCIGGGSTWHLPRLVGLARAKEMVYTGRVVDGREAVELGLALKAVPGERLLDEAIELARALAARAPRSLRLAKEHLAAAAERSLDEALEAETEAILGCMETEDWREGARAFAARRPPTFTGS